MIVGIAVVTTVDSNDESDVTRTSANVTARRRAGSKRGAGEGRGVASAIGAGQRSRGAERPPSTATLESLDGADAGK
jgi:hypothetical protein